MWIALESGKARAAREVQVLAALVKGFDFSCHPFRVRLGTRSVCFPGLMFSYRRSLSHPNGCQMYFFFFSDLKSLWLGETSRCCANHQIIHTNWHHLMSRTTSSKRNYIHLNLSNTSAKETAGKKKNCLPSIYGECKPQRQKWDMCKLLWMRSSLCDECSMYNTGRERGGNLYSLGFEKGGKSKGMLFQS